MGEKKSPETRARMKEAQRKRAAETILLHNELPDRRRCAKCREWKDGDDFPIYRKKLVSGIRVYLYPYCKECQRKRAQEYRERVGPEKMREKNRIAHARYWRRKRDFGGTKVRVRSEPFLVWMEDFLERTKDIGEYVRNDGSVTRVRWVPRYSYQIFADVAGIDESMLRKAMRREENQTLDLSVVDAIMTYAGEQHLLHALYDRSDILRKRPRLPKDVLKDIGPPERGGNKARKLDEAA